MSEANRKKRVPFTPPRLPKEYAAILEFIKDPVTSLPVLLGCGTFGAVFKVTLRKPLAVLPAVSHSVSTDELLSYVALKIQHPTYYADKKLLAEYRILKILGGHCNVVELLFYIFDVEQKILTFAFPYFEQTPFRVLVSEASETEIKAYMVTLCTALEWIHINNVIHRDIKYSNFMFSRALLTGKLIDFGLAVYMNELEEGCTSNPKNSGDYHVRPRPLFGNTSTITIANVGFLKQKKLVSENVHVVNPFPIPAERHAGSPGFKALEVLLVCDLISSAIDIYAVGCILILLLLRKQEFFAQETKEAGVFELVCLYGTKNVVDAVTTLGLKLDVELHNAVYEEKLNNAVGRKSVKQIICDLRSADSPFSPIAFEFLAHLLHLCPAKRMTASQALHHPFLKVEKIFPALPS